MHGDRAPLFYTRSRNSIRDFGTWSPAFSPQIFAWVSPAARDPLFRSPYLHRSCTPETQVALASSGETRISRTPLSCGDVQGLREINSNRRAQPFRNSAFQCSGCRGTPKHWKIALALLEEGGEKAASAPGDAAGKQHAYSLIGRFMRRRQINVDKVLPRGLTPIRIYRFRNVGEDNAKRRVVVMKYAIAPSVSRPTLPHTIKSTSTNSAQRTLRARMAELPSRGRIEKVEIPRNCGPGNGHAFLAEETANKSQER